MHCYIIAKHSQKTFDHDSTTTAKQSVAPLFVDMESKGTPAPQLNTNSSSYGATQQYSSSSIRSTESLPPLEAYQRGNSVIINGATHYDQHSHPLAALTPQHRTNSSSASRSYQATYAASANVCASASANASKDTHGVPKGAMKNCQKVAQLLLLIPVLVPTSGSLISIVDM